jgi:hypothetical protein
MEAGMRRNVVHRQLLPAFITRDGFVLGTVVLKKPVNSAMR